MLVYLQALMKELSTKADAASLVERSNLVDNLMKERGGLRTELTLLNTEYDKLKNSVSENWASDFNI